MGWNIDDDEGTSDPAGQPIKSIAIATALSMAKLLDFFLAKAPMPKNTTATLWVPKAVAKGSPIKIKSGN